MAITRFEDLDLSRQYTYADYLTWKFEERVELLRGWVAQMAAAPNRFHQRVATNFATTVLSQIDRPCQGYIAPFDVRLRRTDGGESVVQPDVCVICDPTKLTQQGCDGAPDWVIEVLSPGNSKREMRDKYALYEESGVREYWIIDPTHGSVSAYVLEDGRFAHRPPMFEDDEQLSSGVFPEVKLSGEALFLD